MTDAKVLEWLKALRYLPTFMRDFHDQNDIFKAMHSAVNVEGHKYAKDVNWVIGQCYVIDIFLWFMARHGYVLRKADAKLPFDDIDETVGAELKRRNDAMARALGLTPLQSQ